MQILIADSARRVRSALKLYIEHCRSDATIIEAASLSEIQAAVAGSTIDVALIDWHLPERGGPEALRLLRNTQPKANLIVLSGRPEVRPETVTAKADGFINKGDPPDSLHALLECATNHREAPPARPSETTDGEKHRPGTVLYGPPHLEM